MFKSGPPEQLRQAHAFGHRDLVVELDMAAQLTRAPVTGQQFHRAALGRGLHRHLAIVQSHRGAHQRRQRGRRGDEFPGIAIRHREPELGSREDRQCGGGAHAEHARSTEQRVDHHRDEGRVQANLDRQAGHGGVGHRLRQHDSGRRQAGDDVEA